MIIRLRQRFKWIGALGFSLWLFAGVFVGKVAAEDISKTIRDRYSLLQPADVAIVYKINDARSEEIARYYAQARNVPAENLIGVEIPASFKDVLRVDEFEFIKRQITSKLESQKILLLVWRTPFAVQCNSITSALTLGFDPNQCSNTCAPGKTSPYFNSASLNPWEDYQLRLSMLLPVTDLTAAKALIDRGVMSEFALNEASGYFLKTHDAARSKPRERFYPPTGVTVKSKKLSFFTLEQDDLQNKPDVMFYFTGRIAVENLSTNNYLPGAIADHLTSTGGILLDNSAQMPATRWLEAGVTGSYGTVSEPCNYWEKFPNPQVVMAHYLAGETLIEAYWKSVKWPTQGLFVGEPLAKPYAKRVPVRDF